MTWQKVDDRLATHPKVRAAGLEAMGLWVTCGSLVSQSLSDGVVPAWYVAGWPDGDVVAKRLVDVGLWHAPGHDCPACPQPPAGDWIFHEWSQANPSRADVLAEREAVKERQKRWRDKAKSSTNASDNGSPNPSRNSSHNASRNASTNAVTNGAPSRPVPRTKSVVTLVALLTNAGNTGVTTTTIENWAAKNTPGVDVETETAAFLTKNQGKQLHDPRAAWQAWMRKARPDQPVVPARATTVGLPPAADAPRCPEPGHEHELAGHCRICASEAIEASPEVEPEQEGTS